MTRSLAVALVLGLVACRDTHVVEADTDGTTTGASATLTSFTATVGSADASAGSTGTPPEPETVLDATLELETLEQVTVVLVHNGETLDASVTLSRGYDVAPASRALVGPARVDAFPEAGAILYTARLDGPAQPGGPCGTDSVSLALSLHWDQDAGFVAGGLTPYCGAGVWWGVPAIEPLRISGLVR
jgi:hypothetical protein